MKFAMTRATRLLWAAHLVGNALLLWLAYYWLGVGESTNTRLAWSAFVALFILCAALWLHGWAFAYFRSSERSSVTPALRTASRNLLPLVVVAVAAAGIYGLLAWWHDYSTQPAFTFASYITLKLRKPVKPATVQRVFNAALWVVRWVLFPVLLLPIVSAVSSGGWSGLRSSAWRVARRWLYWIEVVVLLFCGVWVPLKLIEWVPGVSGFALQTVSFAFRLAIGYLLFVAAWLLLGLFSSGGSPRVSQVRTASAP